MWHAHPLQVVANFGGKDPREYSISTKRFVLDDAGKLKGLDTVLVEWTEIGGKWSMEEIKGSEKFYPAQLVLLALGFLGPQNECIKALDVKQDPRSNIETPNGKYSTSVPGVYAAGDCRRGQSLVVWGIKEGRQCAEEVDNFLMGSSTLAFQGGIAKRSWLAPPASKSITVVSEAASDRAGMDTETVTVAASA